MSKRILVIVDSIEPNSSSGAKANVALIKNLNAASYILKVYHYSGREIEIKDVECILIREQKFTVYYLLSRFQRIFARITKLNINPRVEAVFGFSFTFFNDVKSIKTAIKSIDVEDYDKVLTLSYASSFRPHWAILEFPKWHSKWWAYIHDPYPMHSYPRPYDWVEPGHQFKRNFFLRMVAKAEKIIYPSKLLAEWMQSYYHKQEGKELIIPHQLASTSTNKKDLPDFYNPEKFNVLHAGNMMSARNPIALIKAFKLFLMEHPEAQKTAQLLFIGSASIFDDYIREQQVELSQLYLSNGSLPYNQVLTMQYHAAVNVILEAKGPISPFLPGKFPHCVQANKPILLLGPYYSESKRLLGEAYNYWSEIDDVDAIKNCLTKLFDLWKSNKDNLKLNRNDLKDYMSPGYLKEQLK
jgi:hypothetical protein